MTTTSNQTNTLTTAAIAIGAVALGKYLWRKFTEYDLRGKTVLVTGGSRGLGLVLAREFANNGARVAICARDAEELEQATDDLAGRGAEVIAIACDVRNRNEVENMMNRRADVVNESGQREFGGSRSATDSRMAFVQANGSSGASDLDRRGQSIRTRANNDRVVSVFTVVVWRRHRCCVFSC